MESAIWRFYGLYYALTKHGDRRLQHLISTVQIGIGDILIRNKIFFPGVEVPKLSEAHGHAKIPLSCPYIESVNLVERLIRSIRISSGQKFIIKS